MNPFYELSPVTGRRWGVGGKTSASKAAAEGRKWRELCYNHKAQRRESQVEACAANGFRDCGPKSSNRSRRQAQDGAGLQKRSHSLQTSSPGKAVNNI